MFGMARNKKRLISDFAMIVLDVTQQIFSARISSRAVFIQRLLDRCLRFRLFVICKVTPGEL